MLQHLGFWKQHANTRKISKNIRGPNGILGALQENLIDTSLNSAEEIKGLRSTPAELSVHADINWETLTITREISKNR